MSKGGFVGIILFFVEINKLIFGIVLCSDDDVEGVVILKFVCVEKFVLIRWVKWKSDDSEKCGVLFVCLFVYFGYVLLVCYWEFFVNFCCFLMFFYFWVYLDYENWRFFFVFIKKIVLVFMDEDFLR